MSNVTLTIGGRRYTVACTPGQESHIADLGRMIDGKVVAGGAMAQNETRMLLFAALMMADELHEERQVRDEATQRIAQIEARIEGIVEQLAEDDDAHP